MSDNDIGTTDDAEETSTQEETSQEKQPEATQDDDQVTLSKKDYQKLVSQRDKNFDEASTNKQRLDAIEAEKNRDAFLDGWLADEDVKKKYPDVTKADLKYAMDEDDVEAIAKQTQKRVQEIEQRALKKLEVTSTQPQFTETEAEKELEKLAEAADKGDDPEAFEKAINVQFNTKKRK